MAILNNTEQPTENKINKKQNKKSLIFIVTAVVLVAIISAITILVSAINSNKNATPTEFVEQKVKVVKQNEVISINDPLLGTIEIEAVPGFAKNTYVNDNFVTDETGKMTYYIDGQVASCMGVDLSEYQGPVDFVKLKEQGFDFVILRIGGRYYSDAGAMYVDTNYHQYYKAAKDAGLKVGGYFFSQAQNAEEGREEAEAALQSMYGYEFEYPIAFDWELIEGDTARTDNVEGEQLTDAAIAFCDTIKEAGYKPIIYTNTHLMYYKYDLTRLKDYEFWIADYEDKPSMYYNFTMWQYNIEGRVDGIDGNVDLNICMKNY